jgi:hypothetical protein
VIGQGAKTFQTAFKLDFTLYKKSMNEHDKTELKRFSECVLDAIGYWARNLCNAPSRPNRWYHTHPDDPDNWFGQVINEFIADSMNDAKVDVGLSMQLPESCNEHILDVVIRLAVYGKAEYNPRVLGCQNKRIPYLVYAIIIPNWPAIRSLLDEEALQADRNDTIDSLATAIRRHMDVDAIFTEWIKLSAMPFITGASSTECTEDPALELARFATVRHMSFEDLKGVIKRDLAYQRRYLPTNTIEADPVKYIRHKTLVRCRANEPPTISPPPRKGCTVPMDAPKP